MSYNTLDITKQNNSRDYQINYGSHDFIPKQPNVKSNYGKLALDFIRDDCRNLKVPLPHAFITKKINFYDYTSENVRQDLDRLCFENAIARFLETGTQEDAFDIYYCYCEIFQPFGTEGGSIRLLLDLLNEHENNASSLMEKHRDHYSHSAYVFIIGLAIYKAHHKFRNTYNKKYNLTDPTKAAHHFLQYWGLTSLFHDIGYPFEIAHQQIKAYAQSIDLDGAPAVQGKKDFAPFVSYGRMDEFVRSSIGDLNQFYARALTEYLQTYTKRLGGNDSALSIALYADLADRAIHRIPAGNNYHFLDHAYFSALILAKTYLRRKPEIKCFEDVDKEYLDCFCSILLHNSLFRFSVQALVDEDLPEGKKRPKEEKPLRLGDGMPLTYLLMLCDELQCWGRSSYGHNTRKYIYPFDFELKIENGNSLCMDYFFDKTYEARARVSDQWKKLERRKRDDSEKPDDEKRIRCQFLDDISTIIQLNDVIPAYDPDTTKDDDNEIITPCIKEYDRHTHLTLSQSNYVNLYNLAVELNASYDEQSTSGNQVKPSLEEKTKKFEDGLTLEYKLSNIAQARRYGRVLQEIGCFYTDRPVDLEPVTSFTDDELIAMACKEHALWCDEKKAMGWSYGTEHVTPNTDEKQIDKKKRDTTRRHHMLRPYGELKEHQKQITITAMKTLLNLLRSSEGLIVYRLPKTNFSAVGGQTEEKKADQA